MSPLKLLTEFGKLKEIKQYPTKLLLTSLNDWKLVTCFLKLRRHTPCQL